MFLFVIQRLEGTWGSAYLNFIALIWFFLYRYVCRTDIDLWHLRIVNIFFSAVESLNLALFNDVSKSSKRPFFNYDDTMLTIIDHLPIPVRKLWWNSFTVKVRIFLEGHKIWKNLPDKIWRYWVTSNFKWKISSNFLALSEYPNFIR